MTAVGYAERRDEVRDVHAPARAAGTDVKLRHGPECRSSPAKLSSRDDRLREVPHSRPSRTERVGHHAPSLGQRAGEAVQRSRDSSHGDGAGGQHPAGDRQAAISSAPRRCGASGSASSSCTTGARPICCDAITAHSSTGSEANTVILNFNTALDDATSRTSSTTSDRFRREPCRSS